MLEYCKYVSRLSNCFNSFLSIPSRNYPFFFLIFSMESTEVVDIGSSRKQKLDAARRIFLTCYTSLLGG